jgi:hypothetical protein
MLDINWICLVNINRITINLVKCKGLTAFPKYFVLCRLTLSHVRHKSNMSSKHISNLSR